MTPFQSWLQSRNHNGLPWETSTKELEAAFEAGWIACIEANIANHESERPRGIPPQPDGPSPEDIYKAYPRHVGRVAALKAIEKAIKRLGGQPVHIGLEDFDILKAKYGMGATITASRFILAKTEAYAAATATWPEEEKKYIPYPASWFNAGCYDDDPKEWQRSAAAGSQFGKTH
jgi:hypothetical protein